MNKRAFGIVAASAPAIAALVALEDGQQEATIGSRPLLHGDARRDDGTAAVPSLPNYLRLGLATAIIPRTGRPS
jgi:hypothetical protein